MNTLSEITEFLAPRKLAIAGASRNPKKFGGTVFAELRKRGFELYPVHPDAKELDGVPCFASVKELPAGLDRLYIVTPKRETEGVVRDAVTYGIKHLWIQQMSDTPEALAVAREHGMSVISGRCMMMFAGPVSGVHGFHRWMMKLFGKFPK